MNLDTIEFYLHDRVNRKDYAKMLPVLRGVKKMRLKEMEWEEGFVKLLRSQFPDSEALIRKGIEWWKNKVIEKRPLQREDAKAVRMISGFVKRKGVVKNDDSDEA